MKTYILLLYIGMATGLSAQTTQLCTDFYCVNGTHGIGTEVTNGYKLAVKGKVIAEELKVQVYPWADFVFEDHYKLPTLTAVEKHIKAKGHLQDIPSAQDVEKNGINIGEMDAKLLQKIEELTLYVIAKQEKINNQKARLAKLEALLTQN